MDKKSRSVAIQIGLVAVLALALIVYSFVPAKMESARMQLRVLKAHRGLKQVLAATQGRTQNQTHSLPWNLFAEIHLRELPIDKETKTFLPDLRKTPRSPFTQPDSAPAPVILGQRTGPTSYWYVYLPGPGGSQTPPIHRQAGPPALSSDQWYAITNGLHSPGYLYRDTMGNVSMGSTR